METKTHQIKFRLTAAQKEQVDKYCEAQGITVSALMRQALAEYLNGGKQNAK